MPSSPKKPSKPATETPPSVDEFPPFGAATGTTTSDSMFGLNSNTNLFNFKELSIQLLSSFTSFPTTTTTATTLTAPGSDEFIDNEIYKFVLHGGSRASTTTARVGDAAAVIEMMNPKEAYENEELGKKIATFQIDTDSDEEESDLDNDEQQQKAIIDQTSKTNANVAATGQMNEKKSSSSLSKERAPKSSDKM